MSFFRASQTRYPQTIMQPRENKERGRIMQPVFESLCGFAPKFYSIWMRLPQTNNSDFWHNERQLQCLHSPHSNNLILQLSLCKNPIKCVWNSVKSKAPSSLKANIKYSCGQKCPLTPSSLFSTSLITCKWTVGSCWDHQPLSSPLPTGSGDLYKPLSLPSGCRRPLPRRLAAAGPKLWWHTGEKLRGGKRSIKETMCFTIITCLALSPPPSITHGSLPQKPCSAFLEVSQGTHLNRDAFICLRVTYGLSDWGAAGKH